MLVMQRPKVEALGEADGDRQLFAVGPLEPGFGHTLGNSLRRTLLSSIPGAAVTQVRFDDALHEFDTIEGVTEDVTDIILNLKDLVLRVHSDEPVTLRLDVRGAADVTAADIQTTADVEILNPDLHLATRQRQRPPGPRPHRREGPGLRLRRPEQDVEHHRCHPGRLDLLAGPAGHLLGGADPGRAVHRVRPAGARHRDRRLAHGPRRRWPRPGPRCAVARAARRRDERRAPGSRARRGRRGRHAGPPTSTCPSRTSICPSVPATASSGPRSTRSASCCSRPRTTCWPSPTSARSPSTRSSRSSTSAVCRSSTGTEETMPATPRKSTRFGGSRLPPAV